MCPAFLVRVAASRLEWVSPESGEKIFWGDGQCSTCHKIGSSGSATRGPDQEGLSGRAEERAKEVGLPSIGLSGRIQ